MANSQDTDAWNNFVMNSQPGDYPKGTFRRFAALAKSYMSEANSGGINSFLTNNWEFDGLDVLEALNTVGAISAAQQFSQVLQKLGRPVTASSQDARWDLLEDCWPQEADDDFDVLSPEADRDLQKALELHVKEDEVFYHSLRARRRR